MSVWRSVATASFIRTYVGSSLELIVVSLTKYFSVALPNHSFLLYSGEEESVGTRD